MAPNNDLKIIDTTLRILKELPLLGTQRMEKTIYQYANYPIEVNMVRCIEIVTTKKDHTYFIIQRVNLIL